jgi:RHS repeat-associated protein
MVKRFAWVSLLAAFGVFAGQVVIKSNIFGREQIGVAGESTWDRLSDAASQTTQELWNSVSNLAKSGSFAVSDAAIQSLAGELPAHDATVGTTAGQAGVSGGSASYSIPIVLPPGRKGMQPNISLSYSSRSGNGIAGMGWSISGLSSVHRCPMTVEQDGQIRAVDYSLNDRLCLDGQRLVATSGTYGAVNTKYATEIDSFARITQLGGDLNAVNSYFKVEYKSGEISYFGATSTGLDNARVIAGGLTKPLSWLIDFTQDRLGNNVYYTYNNFGNGEVQPAIIYYTGFNSVIGDRKVEFSYETRPSAAGTNDQSSSYLAGGLTRQTQRLTKIATKAGTELIREYYLNYGTAVSATSGRSLLRSVQECAWVGTTSTCRRPTTFSWNDAAIKYDFHPLDYSSISALIPNPDSVLGFKAAADFNGDGDNEWGISYQDANNANVSHFNLVRMTPERQIASAFVVPGNVAISSDQYGDFDLDGRADILSKDANGNLQVNFWHGPADATKFAAAFNDVWNTGINGATIEHVGDMEGDGRADIVIKQDNPNGASNCKSTIQVLRNIPSGSSAPSTFSSVASHCLARTTFTGTAGQFYVDESVSDVRDLNGDGLPDITILKPNGLAAPLKDRILFGTRVSTYALTSQAFSSFFIGTDPMQADEQNPATLSFWVDMNGDGLDDFLYARNDAGVGRWTIRLNTGTKMGTRVLLSSTYGIEFCDPVGSALSCPTTYWNTRYGRRMRVMDTNNDGRAEILVPRRIGARYCKIVVPNPAICGEPLSVGDPNSRAALITPVECQTRYVCPENPATGQLELEFQSQFNNGDTGNTVGAYTSSLGVTDSSIYQMDALQFTEIGAGQFSVNATPTTVMTGYASTSPQDAYGDGLADAFTQVGCKLPYCVIPLANSAGTAYSSAVSPQSFMGGYSILGSKNFINENLGPNAVLNTDGKTPQTPDMMVSATDGLNNQVQWTYYPLSSKANRAATDTPLYSLPSGAAQRYIDDRHTYFASSMQVVAEMRQTNAIGSGFNTTRYGYSEAMYNTQGRGFQGFRQIIEEDLASGLRTATTFHQKYPLTSLVEKIYVNPISRPLANSPVSQTDNGWRCNRANRNDTTACAVTPGSNPVRFVYQAYSEHVTFDLETSLAGLPYKTTGFTADYYADTTACDGATISTTSGYDAYGNVLAKTHFVSDYSDGTPGYKNYIALSCNRTHNTFAAADTTNWWLDKLTNTEVRNEILYGADQPLPAGASSPVYTTNTAYSWNTNRTLASETFQNTIANQQKVTAYTYPAAASNYGLPLSVKVTGSGDQSTGGRTTSTTYSADGYFPLSVTNALTHTATTVVRVRDGQPVSVTDPNGLRTLTDYDAFGVATRIKYRGALDTQYLAPDKHIAMQWCPTGGCWSNPGASYQRYEVQDGSPTTVNFYWQGGMLYVHHTKGIDGLWRVFAKHYDARGLLTDETDPWIGGDPTGKWTHYRDYDALGRLGYKYRQKDDGSANNLITDYVYLGRSTDITVFESDNPYGPKRLNLSRSTDAMGRYVETRDALNGITKFWFDANGQAAVLQDVKGNQIKATYNAIGQRSNVSDPNQGASSFTYNALGEVLTQTDARGIVMNFTYDKLGRKTKLTATSDANGDGTNDAIVDTWAYDPAGAKGQLSISKRTINAVTERQDTSAYDSIYIRPITQTTLQNTGGTTTRTYVTDIQYDAYYGRVKAQFMPNGEGEQFIYNQYGYETEQRNATSAAIYRQVVSTNARGQVTRELKGFNLATDTVYWPDGQVKQITHTKDGVAIRKLNYAYDVFGNVATQELNNGLTGNTLESFAYDKLHRMTQSTRTGAANSTVTYGYDAAGNFNFKSDFSTATGTPYNLATGGLGGGGANAVKSVILNTGATRSYGYDASGNLISDNAGFSARYDHANLATKLQRNTLSNFFTYGANNEKAKQTGTDGTKAYVGSYEDWVTAAQTKVSLGNYAQITNGTGGRQLHYFLTDRLGSVDAVTNNVGTLIETRGFDAFGAPRTGTWGDASQIASTAITPKGFTSHEHLNSIQLIHMNGRMYDYQLGRFLSVDPFIQMPTNSQSLNPYSYIMNNPLSGTDPTGYAACGVDFKDGTVCEATVTKEVTDKKTGEIKTEKKTYTIANNGGNLFIAEGAGKSAQKAVLGAINDFGGASKRNNIAGFHAPRMGIETSSAGGPSRDAMGDLPEARLYNMDAPEKPNPILSYFGDIVGSFQGQNGAYRHNPFTGEMIEDPTKQRMSVLIAVATFRIPITRASASGEGVASSGIGTTAKNTANINELIATHGKTMSNKQLEKLVKSIRSEGIKTPLTITHHEGKAYVLDGNHRLLAAPRAGLKEVPVRNVELPFGAYKTPANLDYSPGGY